MVNMMLPGRKAPCVGEMQPLSEVFLLKETGYLVACLIQKEQYRFHPSCETVEHPFTLVYPSQIC